MSNAFNKHHDGKPRCSGCDRVAVIVQVGADRRLCLPCLKKRQPETYFRLFHWVQDNPPVKSNESRRVGKARP